MRPLWNKSPYWQKDQKSTCFRLKSTSLSVSADCADSGNSGNRKRISEVPEKGFLKQRNNVKDICGCIHDRNSSYGYCRSKRPAELGLRVLRFDHHRYLLTYRVEEKRLLLRELIMNCRIMKGQSYDFQGNRQ